MNSELKIIAASVAALFFVGVAYAQISADYNPPALGASEAEQRSDLDAEYDNINTLKVDFTDMDTSAELRSILTDETGTGSAMFGISSDMSDILNCAAQEAVRRNAGDTGWECFAPGVGGGLAATDIDTSAELRAIIGDETGTGAAMFGITTAMADDIACAGSQSIRRNAGDTAWECFSAAGGVVTTDIDTSSELRGIVTDEVGTGALMFGLASTMSDDISCGASQVLRRNSADTGWECATVASGMTLIDSGSFALAATKDWTGLSGYRVIRLVINGARPATDNVDASLKFSTDNGATWTAANMEGGSFHLGTGGGFQGDSDFMSGDDFDLQHNAGTGVGNAAGEGIWADISINSFNQTTNKTMNSRGNLITSDGSANAMWSNGFDTSGVDFDGIRFLFSSGNISANGTYELWGQ